MKTEIKQRMEQIKNGQVPAGYKKTKVGIVPKEWEITHFKRMFSRLCRKNTEGNTNVLTISAQYGLISQEDFFKKSVASDDKSNYYLLYKGEYAYNKSYSTGYPFGALKKLERYDKGIVSPLYICFLPTEENQCSGFYSQYFEAGKMNSEIKAIAQEGARNHGLLNVSVDDFFNTYILAPPLGEQEKISKILELQDKIIELQQKKTDELQKFKKAMLQKMFPKKGENVPEIRFPGFTDTWEQRKLGEIANIQKGQQLGKAEMSEHGYYYVLNGGIEPSGFSDRYNTAANTISISEGGNSCGYVTLNLECFWSGGHNYTLQNPQLNTNYLYQWLKKQEKTIMALRVGSGLPNIQKSALQDVVVLYPSNNEQRMIATILMRLDNLITLHQRKLEEYKTYKKSLMQLLLTGIVRVKI